MNETANDMRLAANEIMRLLYERGEQEQLYILYRYAKSCLELMSETGDHTTKPEPTR